MNLRFSPRSAAIAIVPEAFDLYLRGSKQPTGWLAADADLPLLEQAVLQAPSFARAWAALAIRLAIGGVLTERRHLEQLWQLLDGLVD